MPRLTKTFVDQLTAPGHYRDSELPGFCLRVVVSPSTKRSRKTYLINTKPKGRRTNTTITIGTHGVISTEKARNEAKRLLGLLAQGIHPNEEARKARARKNAGQRSPETNREDLDASTLRTLLVDYLKARKPKERTAKGYTRLVTRTLEDWLDLPITAISRDMVQERHMTLSAEHPAQANYTMRVLRALFTYAMAVYEDEHGKSLLMINPVDRLKHARIWNRIPRRQTVIRPHQLSAWYQALQSIAETPRDVLLLELFTGFRHSEAIGLEWKNVDFQDKTILVKDTKNHDDHMLPMSTYLYQIMLRRRATADSDFVFPGGGIRGHITDLRDSITEVCRLSGVQFTEHDLRRTFETAAESLDISYYSLKKLLNHRITNDPTAGYIVASAERLRESAQKIADHFALHLGILNKPASRKRTMSTSKSGKKGKVINFRRQS